jgi:hypothetical protein
VVPLAVRTLEQGVAYPTARDDADPDHLFMGVYDAAGDYVEGTVLDRRSGITGAPVPTTWFSTIEDAATPAAIYGGPIYHHFGHFLLESLARAWYAHRHPELPLVWVGARTWDPDQELLGWQTEILDILGVVNPIRITTAPLRVPTLHVPDIGYRYDDTFHPEHAAFLGRHAGPPQEPGERLWLSRSALRSDIRDLNAAPLERRLADAGWTLVHPQRLTVREQLAHFARAEVVAGEEGSAFHLLALLDDLTGKKLEVFRRHGREHPNMTTIGEARHIDQTFHTLRGEQVVAAQGRTVTKLSPNASEALDVLGVPVPPDPPPTEPPAVTDALCRVVADVPHDRLLVIGDPGVGLVLASTASRRIAVSPRFDGDPRAHADSGVDFFEVDPEQYLEHFHRSGKVGVIRLVGPDPEAVLATFDRTLPLARPRTTWVLGPGAAGADAAALIGDARPEFAVRTVTIGDVVLHLVSRVPEHAEQPDTDADGATAPATAPDPAPPASGVRGAADRLRGLARSVRGGRSRDT